MKLQALGEYIRDERKRQNLTQGQLGEGICEPMTVSRLERGTRIPVYHWIIPMLQRLGLPDGQFVALLSRREVEIQDLRDDILADAIRFERALKEEQPGIRAAGLEKLARLEELGKDDRVIRQYVLSHRATLGTPEGSYSHAEKRKILLEALRMTVPRFDLEEIHTGLYSLDETTLINKIAITYALEGERRRAIDVYRQLLRYIQKHYQRLPRYAGKLSLVASNYARELLLEKRYEEAIEIAELGRETCLLHKHYQSFPGLLDLLGECASHMEEPEKCRKLYQQAYCIYTIVTEDSSRTLLKEEMLRLNLSTPF